MTPESDRPLIITASRNVSLVLRLRDVFFTILLWCAFIFMVQDFFSFLQDFYYWLLDDSPLRAYPKLHVLATLRSYAVSLALFTVCFVAWPIYNRIRFKNKKRRGFGPPLTSDEIAEFYKVDPSQIEQWQNTRAATVHLDDDGKLVKIELN